MITYYTALGKIEFEESKGAKKPVAYKEDKAHYLDEYEFCLWTQIVWDVQTYDELQKQYQKKRQELRLFDDRPFDHVLSRLTERGLIASGMGYTAADALYELISKLRLHPLHLSRIATLKTVVYLLFQHRISLPKILQNIKGYPLSGIQKDILNLSKQVLMTPAELIKCMEKGVVEIRTEEQLIDTIYQEDFTYENLHNDTRFSSLKNPIMKAVVDLYLNKQIIFE